MKSSRRRAREFALQGLYQLALSGNTLPEIEAHLAASPDFEKADPALFIKLFRGVSGSLQETEALIQPHLDRNYADLAPIERAILLVAVFELRHQIETPCRVILNEAIDLAKSFGGTDGHKFVNGVLDRLATQLRPDEMAATNAARAAASPKVARTATRAAPTVTTKARTPGTTRSAARPAKPNKAS